MIALTLPQDVIDSLQTLHRDPAWAIVQLAESMFGKRRPERRSKAPTALAELLDLPGKRGLIVVQPQGIARLAGVSTIPLADGRAFLAFDHAAGLADLEVAIVDRLEVIPRSSPESARLVQILEAVRGWRRNPNLVFRTKSIIVVQPANVNGDRSLGGLSATGLSRKRLSDPRRQSTAASRSPLRVPRARRST